MALSAANFTLSSPNWLLSRADAIVRGRRVLLLLIGGLPRFRQRRLQFGQTNVASF